MKSIMWRKMAAAGLLVTGLVQGVRADDVTLSDAPVQGASYEVATDSYELSAMRAAFLDDSPSGIGAPVRVSDSLGTLTKNGKLPGGICDCGGVCQCGAVSYDVVPASALGGSSCACDACGTQGGSACDLSEVSDSCEGPGAVYYAEIQMMWLRAHIMEDAIGKLSESYKWTPRVVAGFENAHGVGARGRWWHYGHATPILGSNDELDLNFDVIDGEVTARFAMKGADLVVSGGARWTNIEIAIDSDSISLDGPGLTAAADLRVHLCGGCNWQWASVGGVRLSTVGGDWEGGGGFVEPVRDDNLVVQEFYAGTEYTYVTERGHNLYARLVFEVQNWHSDAAAQLAGTDSIGFIGPGVHVGASF